jgi:hypothetical protein
METAQAASREAASFNARSIPPVPHDVTWFVAAFLRGDRRDRSQFVLSITWRVGRGSSQGLSFRGINHALGRKTGRPIL